MVSPLNDSKWQNRGSDRIHSPLFPNLALTAQQVLNGNVKN
ncbi:hypothetical protein [Coleofasciculus sp.]